MQHTCVCVYVCVSACVYLVRLQSSPEEAQEYGKAMKALADADTAKYGSIGRMQFRSMAPMLAASAVFSSTFFAVRALLGSQVRTEIHACGLP